MSKTLFIPLFATAAVLVGCQPTETTQTADQVMEQRVAQALWVGEFEGTTPCLGCLSRCEDCPGMKVSLRLNEDNSYVLHRESLSEHNALETLSGTYLLTEDDEVKIQLIDIQQRNLMVFDPKKMLLEIREDSTGKSYQMQSDFILPKVTQA